MGRRNDELTPELEAQADELLRELLASYGEPREATPPLGLARRVLAALPAQPAAAPRVPGAFVGRFGLRLAAALALALVVLGLWGVLVDSSGPASLFGGATSGVGSALLVLTLAAKPLVGSLLALDLLSLVGGALFAAAVGWGWWSLVQRPLPGGVEVAP